MHDTVLQVTTWQVLNLFPFMHFIQLLILTNNNIPCIEPQYRGLFYATLSLKN